EDDIGSTRIEGIRHQIEMNQPRATARWNDEPRISEVYFNSLLDVVRALEVVPACYNEALDGDRFDSGDGPTEGVTSLTETLPDPIERASQRIVIVAVTDAAPEIETPLPNADDEPPIDSPSHVQSDVPSDAIGSLQAEPAGLPAALLAAVEARLAVHVGPVARVLVARYSARQADFPQLSARLADHVPSIAAREQFMRALETMHGIFETASGKSEPPANTGLQNVQSASPPDEAAPSAVPLPEQVESAAFQLARYLGPIARVIARREAAIAADLQSFHRRLAEAISNEADRAAFQRAVS
ncbi:hypothetical protein AB3X96_38640, partial [Paraburkholderia sp. BR13439]